MASPTQWTWVWVDSWSWWWTGRSGMLQPMDHKKLDTPEQLNWTEFQSMLVHWFLKCRCLLLPSPLWPLPIYLDSWTRFLCNSFQIAMQFVLFSIRLYFHHRSHTQLGIVFTLAQSLIVSGIICPFFSSSILGTYQPGEFIFQCHIFLPFYAVHGVLKGRILKWLAFPFSSGPRFVRILHYDPSILGGPKWHGS